MEDGRPLYEQDELEPDKGTQEAADVPEEQPSSAEVSAEQVAAIRKEMESFGNRLLFSETWSSEPQIANQAKLYPDTVRSVSIAYKIFNARDEKHMELYSEIQLSHRAGRKYRILSDEDRQWCPAQETWMILMLVEERKFKTTRTANLTPGE